MDVWCVEGALGFFSVSFCFLFRCVLRTSLFSSFGKPVDFCSDIGSKHARAGKGEKEEEKRKER